MGDSFIGRRRSMLTTKFWRSTEFRSKNNSNCQNFQKNKFLQVANRSVEQLQRLLRDARGPVTFKIVPSYRSAPPACEIFVRAQYVPKKWNPRKNSKFWHFYRFDYDPAQDDLIPCASAGVPFRTGDVLQVISKDDHNWWQGGGQILQI